MNSAAMARSLYAQPTQEVGTLRGIEYKAFSKVTARLASQATGNGSFGEMAEALCENQLLWTTLGASVAHSKNALSPELRAQIFYLTEFTNLHTRKVMDGKATADILVEINTSIMRGLRNCESDKPVAFQ